MMTVYDILNDQVGTFTNSGDLIVENNFMNQGDFLNASAGIIDLNNSHELRAHYEIFRESNYSNLNIDFTNTSPKKDPGKQSLDTSVAATMVEFYCAISKKKGTLNIIMTKNQSKIIDLCILKTLFDGALTIVDKPTH